MTAVLAQTQLGCSPSHPAYVAFLRNADCFPLGSRLFCFIALLVQQWGWERCRLPAARCNAARKTLGAPHVHTCLSFLLHSAPRFALGLCRYFRSASKPLRGQPKPRSIISLAGLDSAPSAPASPWTGRWTTPKVKGKATIQGPSAALLDS